MIRLRIENYLKKIIKEDAGIGVFPVEQEQFGHYSTNAAMKLAKIRGESPMQIAGEIASNVRGQMSNVFNKIEIAPPGFINFWLKPEVFQSEIKEILKKNPPTQKLRRTRAKYKLNSFPPIQPDS